MGGASGSGQWEGLVGGASGRSVRGASGSGQWEGLVGVVTLSMYYC